MKRFIPLLLLLATPAYSGGITHKITATAQASVDGSYSHAKRIGSTYSMSSTGVTAGTMGHLDVPASSNNSLTGVAATPVRVPFDDAGTSKCPRVEAVIPVLDIE